ncbi:hypothetical protein H1230_16895 [Paenibacillus sp. 19GGS1-52]|uniref:HNH endonuclease n=1 Tax=Paenibacillus sp. 19GGS1-52 TaxID=2758563 RepID=UPI001EFBA717|nr:HNH endonuclease [Paenibacillus sp. 19GGS1-52]ULO04824.1 hypothetical protein H1230_16895 [Paenibacillus sp. 19GGS1-52]
MVFLSKIDAAIKLGISMELLDFFISRCPKPNQTVKLPVTQIANGELLVDEADLVRFNGYLNEPWPLPPSGGRPNIPAAIARDIKLESSFSCAICGDLNNGEIAHIEAVAETLNNGPDNLIYLCPNHHTQYDKGYKIASNLTLEEVRAAKLMKRRNRRRMMRQEQNVTKVITESLKIIKELHEKVVSEPERLTVSVITEGEIFLKRLPDLIRKAGEEGNKDQIIDKADQLILKNMPSISEIIQGMHAKNDKNEISQMMANIAEKTNEIIIELDEVNCPHCNGRGTTGLVGDICRYCEGSCYVSEKSAKEYNPTLIDEVDCPHCHGKGTTGLVGDICGYCQGSCVVTEEEADDYDPNDLDEVDCPHCFGRGTTGLVGDVCSYCQGSCVVTKESADSYTLNDIDEVDCPHCSGRGTIGLNSTVCGFCGGSCTVSNQEADGYDPQDIDQVDCPRCDGRGTIGWSGTVCSYCNGDTVVTRKEYVEFNVKNLDEVSCPRCNGSGTTGLRGDVCKFCRGDTVVSASARDSYLIKYGD